MANQSQIDAWYAWATGTLARINAPTSPTNLQTLWKWSVKESGSNPISNGSIRNNPLNTTQRAPGSVSANSVGVQSFPDVSTGVNATAQTLTNGRYPNIILALRQSVPASSWGGNPALVRELGTWGSGANWLGWSNTPPSGSASNFQQPAGGGASLFSSSAAGNPVTDALAAASAPIAGAINAATGSLVSKAVNLSLIGLGTLLMLAGVALLGLVAWKGAPAGVRSLPGRAGRAAAAVTPQGRTAVATKAAVKPPRPTVVKESPPATEEPEQISAGGKVIGITPEARERLQRRRRGEVA